MSRLEELIQQLCPEGVEYSKLVDVSDILYGYPCDATKFNDDNVGLPLIRIRDVLIGTTTTYTTEKVPPEYIIQTGDLLVGMDGNFHVGNWKDSCGVLCQRVCRVQSKDENIVLNGFLSHYLPPVIKQIELGKPGGTVKHLLAKDVNAIVIPIPPLEVQREVVRILDQFTELTAELTTELTTRKKQYEYYRNNLLNSLPNSIEMQFGKLFQFQNGFAFKSNLFKAQGEPILRITNIKENRIDESGLVYFDPMDYKENLDSFVVEPGDIVVAMSGATTGKIGVNITERSFYLNQRVGKFVPNGNVILKRYLYHLLLQNSNRLLEISQGSGAQPNLSSEKLKKLTAKIPPIPEQKKIVSLLDRFDTLCNDLTSGLPAEIEARRKQYEYYRDKLLTFTELEV